MPMMRGDRGTTLATILILICCIGGSVSSSTIATHRVLIQTVSQQGNAILGEVATFTQDLEIPTIWYPQILDGNLLPLADIEELHNLPPPFLG
jgi:hypothetical protein